MTRRVWLASSALAAVAAAQTTPGTLRLPRTVRLALIGLEGHLGQVLGPLDMLPDVKLVAIADPDPSLLTKVARGPHAADARQYTDYRQLLEREKLDIVAIFGPNAERVPAILAAADRKLHVVAEKPLAIEHVDLERVKRSVEQNDFRMTMLLSMRFESPYIAMKEIVESGEIGEVAQISAQKSHKLGDRPAWMRKHSTFGGTIPYIGIHMVDLMRWVSGRELIEAVSFQSHIGYPEYGDMENNTSTIFRMDNGGTAVLRMDYLRPETAPSQGDDRLRLAGTKGVVEYQAGMGGVVLVTETEKLHVLAKLPKSRSVFVDFLDSVYNGKPPGLELKDVFRASEIVLTARDSAERHQILKT